MLWSVVPDGEIDRSRFDVLVDVQNVVSDDAEAMTGFEFLFEERLVRLTFLNNNLLEIRGSTQTPGEELRPETVSRDLPDAQNPLIPPLEGPQALPHLKHGRYQ